MKQILGNTPLLLTVLSLFLSIHPAVASNDAGPSTVERALAARVNGEPIYLDQLAPLVQVELRKYRKFGAVEPSREMILVTQRKALEALIPTELIHQAARGVEIPELEEKVARQVAEYNRRRGDEEWSLSEEELRERARRQICITEYMERNDLVNPQVPEARILEYYEKNKQNFVSKESVHVRHVLVQVAADASAEEKALARKRVEEASTLIAGGTPFEEVAKEYSEDNAAGAGGDIGFIERGYMPAEFEAFAFSSEPGRLSEVVETSFGFHLIEVLEKNPGGIPPYPKIKDFMGKYLRDRLQREKMDAHLAGLRENARVEVLLK